MKNIINSREINNATEKTKNIQTIRLIRRTMDVAEKEMIKEFFRFVGCMVYDQPVIYYEDVERLINEKKYHDVDIIMNIDVSGISIDTSVVQFEYELGLIDDCTNDEVNDKHKRVFDFLIDKIWKGDTQEKYNLREELKIVLNKFVDNYLVEYLQSKRAFRILNMGEKAGSQLLKNKIKDSEQKKYIGEMLFAFEKVYIELDQEKEKYNSVYTMYAKANLGRKIREVFEIVEEIPDNVLQKFEQNSALGEFKIYKVQALLEDIMEIIKKDDGFVCAYFLAAHICQTDSKYLLIADQYYDLICRILEKEKSKFNAFAYYQRGIYFEKVWHNYELAKTYYEEAVRRDERLYQPKFKLASWNARMGNNITAIRQFEKVEDILLVPMQSDDGNSLHSVCLKGLQYLFKTYVWLKKIADRENSGKGYMYLERAYEVASAYRENKCINRLFGKEHREIYQKYHRNSAPVQALFEILKDAEMY